MRRQAIDYILWLISPCLQAGVVIAMRRRGLDRDFPLFFRYTIFQMLSVPVLVITGRYSYELYYYAYWVVAAFCVLISLGVIAELFRSGFQQTEDPLNLGQAVFRWAVLCLLLAAAGVVLSSSHYLHVHIMTDLVLVADRLSRASLCALAVLLLLCSRYLGISWRAPLIGIASGFSFFTLAKLVVDTVALRSPAHQHALGRINSGVYIGSCLIWMAYMTLAAQRPVADVIASEKLDSYKNRPAGSVLNMINDAVNRKLRH